jgi:hypothetical protein
VRAGACSSSRAGGSGARGSYSQSPRLKLAGLGTEVSVAGACLVSMQCVRVWELAAQSGTCAHRGTVMTTGTGTHSHAGWGREQVPTSTPQLDHAYKSSSIEVTSGLLAYCYLSKSSLNAGEMTNKVCVHVIYT